MKPMLRAIDDDPELELVLIVTDQHVNPTFGATISEISRDFEVAAAIDMEQTDGNPRSRARALGTGMARMADVMTELSPDVVVLYGDRGEVLTAAIVALTLGIPIAHLQGGDISGNVDDSMRHAITKLSHLHFASNEDSAARIRALGEDSWRVHVVGDNHVDPIVAGDFTDAQTVRRRYGVGENERPVIVLYHPETTHRRNGAEYMGMILDAVLAHGRRTIVVYPCSDQGYDGIVQAIDEVRNRDGVSVHENIDSSDFAGLMAIAAVIVGNSSAALIEAPYLGLRAVNIGDRQQGRRHMENVVHCGYCRDDIDRALETALVDPAFAKRVAGCKRPFGDGRAYQRIVDVLKSAKLGPRLFDKRMTV